MKRRGGRTILAVYFRLPSNEMVLVGHYGRPHEEMTADEAVRLIRAAPDARGYEIIVPRRVEPGSLDPIIKRLGPCPASVEHGDDLDDLSADSVGYHMAAFVDDELAGAANASGAPHIGMVGQPGNVCTDALRRPIGSRGAVLGNPINNRRHIVNRRVKIGNSHVAVSPR